MHCTAFTHSFGKFGLRTGARAEYSNIKSNLINTGQAITTSYFKIYPTTHLSYKINETKELRLNYSLRVNRPSGGQLNPFAEYKDPLNIRIGNPYLKPEFIHSVGLGYQWKRDKLTVLPGLFYRYKYNGFTSISTPSATNSLVLVTSQQNLSNDQSMGADVVVSANIGRKISSNFTTNLFYNQINASNLGFSSKRSTITSSFNLNSVITLRSSTMMQINSNYQSARLTPQGKQLPNFVMNIGLRQGVLKKKGSIYLTASDVFKTLRRESDFNNVSQQIYSKTTSNSRIIYLGLNYKFGYTKKEKKEDLPFDNSL